MRVEIEVPDELAKKFNAAIESDYTNRSEAIRDSMRYLIKKLKEKNERKKIPSNAFYAVEGKKQRTDSGVYVCPSCGFEHWMITMQKDGSFKCKNCSKVMASNEKDVNNLIKEKKVDSYVCPICNEVVEDTPSNYTGDVTLNGEMAILCPNHNYFLNGLPFLHHGNCFGDFELKMSDTDYFFAFHKPCLEKQNHGYCEIYANLIDNSGRVIFNLQCIDCKAVDAVKTHVPMFAQGIERIFLSPKLRHRIGEHPWDDI
jgi:Arc/MetJ-type ribon-helix-helix transcriptional regulator